MVFPKGYKIKADTSETRLLGELTVFRILPKHRRRIRTPRRSRKADVEGQPCLASDPGAESLSRFS